MKSINYLLLILAFIFLFKNCETIKENDQVHYMTKNNLLTFSKLTAGKFGK